MYEQLKLSAMVASRGSCNVCWKLLRSIETRENLYNPSPQLQIGLFHPLIDCGRYYASFESERQLQLHIQQMAKVQ